MFRRLGFAFFILLLSIGSVAAQKDVEDLGASYYYNRALIEADHGQHDRAIDNFTQAIERNPNRGDFFYYRGISNQALANYEAVVSDLTEALRLTPTASPLRRFDMLGRRGHAYMQLREFDLAHRNVEEMISLNPTTIDTIGEEPILYGLAFDKQVDQYTEYLAERPDSFVILASRGRLYQQQEDWNRAIVDFTRAIEIRSDHWNARLQRAKSNQELGNFESAIADLDVLVESADHPSIYLNERCRAHARWGIDLDQALADCTAAMRLETYAIYVESRGLVYLLQGNFDAAISDYSLVIDYDPQLPESHFGRGIAHLRNGQTEQGEADIARALELDPDVEAKFAPYGITR